MSIPRWQQIVLANLVLWILILALSILQIRLRTRKIKFTLIVLKLKKFQEIKQNAPYYQFEFQNFPVYDFHLFSKYFFQVDHIAVIKLSSNILITSVHLH